MDDLGAKEFLQGLERRLWKGVEVESRGLEIECLSPGTAGVFG